MTISYNAVGDKCCSWFHCNPYLEFKIDNVQLSFIDT